MSGFFIVTMFGLNVIFLIKTRTNIITKTIKAMDKKISFKLVNSEPKINEVGSIIDVNKAACRDMNLSELLSLLKADIFIFWSWGAHAFTTNFNDVWDIEQKKIVMRANSMFRMRVKGHHHKGHVYIFLNGSDLFDVYLTNLKGQIKKKIMGLYYDQLADWIDENVEKIPAYSR